MNTSSKWPVLRTIRWVSWALVALVVAILVLAWAQKAFLTPAEAKPYATPFELTDQNGKTVTEQTLLGKPSAWFFGFTHCPDVCPTALAEMAQVLTELGPDADKLTVVFVSVDPARDTLIAERTPIDYLDFASPVAGLGSKMGIDATHKWPGENGFSRDYPKLITMAGDVKAKIDGLWPKLGL